MATEDEIHAFHEKHAAVVVQIQPRKRDLRLHFILDLQFAGFTQGEVFPLVVLWSIAQSVVSVDSGASRFNRAIIQIGRLY